MFTTPFFIVSLLKMTKNKDFNPMPEASGCNLLCLIQLSYPRWILTLLEQS